MPWEGVGKRDGAYRCACCFEIRCFEIRCFLRLLCFECREVSPLLPFSVSIVYFWLSSSKPVSPIHKLHSHLLAFLVL